MKFIYPPWLVFTPGISHPAAVPFLLTLVPPCPVLNYLRSFSYLVPTTTIQLTGTDASTAFFDYWTGNYGKVDPCLCRSPPAALHSVRHSFPNSFPRYAPSFLFRSSSLSSSSMFTTIFFSQVVPVFEWDYLFPVAVAEFRLLVSNCQLFSDSDAFS